MDADTIILDELKRLRDEVSMLKRREMPVSAAVAYDGTIYRRSLQDKATERVSVADFGAVGDGATDDWPAIRRALDAFQDTSRGILLHFGPYHYKASGQLVVPSNVDFAGDGMGTTLLDFSGITSTVGLSDGIIYGEGTITELPALAVDIRPVITTTSDLSTYAIAGDWSSAGRIIKFSDTHGLSIGDSGIISNESFFSFSRGNGGFNGEWFEVLEVVNSTTIRTKDRLFANYSATATKQDANGNNVLLNGNTQKAVRLAKITPTGTSIRDMTIKFPYLNISGFRVANGVGVTLRNVRGWNAGARNFYIHRCMDVTLDNVHTRDEGTYDTSWGTYYGVITGYCQRVSMTNCHLDAMRHGWTSGGGTGEWPVANREYTIIGGRISSHHDARGGFGIQMHSNIEHAMVIGVDLSHGAGLSGDNITFAYNDVQSGPDGRALYGNAMLGYNWKIAGNRIKQTAMNARPVWDENADGSDFSLASYDSYYRGLIHLGESSVRFGILERDNGHMKIIDNELYMSGYASVDDGEWNGIYLFNPAGTNTNSVTLSRNYIESTRTINAGVSEAINAVHIKGNWFQPLPNSDGSVWSDPTVRSPTVATNHGWKEITVQDNTCWGGGIFIENACMKYLKGSGNKVYDSQRYGFVVHQTSTISQSHNRTINGVPTVITRNEYRWLYANQILEVHDNLVDGAQNSGIRIMGRAMDSSAVLYRATADAIIKARGNIVYDVGKASESGSTDVGMYLAHAAKAYFEGNIIADRQGTPTMSYAFTLLRIGQTYEKDNDISGSFVTAQSYTREVVRSGEFKGTAAPTSVTYRRGSKVYNTSPNPSKVIDHWVCVTEGTPAADNSAAEGTSGTWEPIGGSLPLSLIVEPRYGTTSTSSPHYVILSGGRACRWDSTNATHDRAYIKFMCPIGLGGSTRTVKALINAPSGSESTTIWSQYASYAPGDAYTLGADTEAQAATTVGTTLVQVTLATVTLVEGEMIEIAFRPRTAANGNVTINKHVTGAWLE